MGFELIVLLMIFIYLFTFISIDELIKKKKKNEYLEHEKSWINYKRTLPKYIP